MNKYMLYDESGDLMRVVGRQEEARYIVNTRAGWSFKIQRTPKFQGYREAEFLGEALI